MSDHEPRHDDHEDDVGPDAEHGPPPGMPRAVKAVAIAVALLIVLAIVAHVAGGGGPARHAPGAEPGAAHVDDTPPIDGAPEVAVAGDDLAFDPPGIEVPAGMPLNVALTSVDVFHDLVVDETGFHLAAQRGETAVGGLAFDEPGTYVGYCSVPGHREAGMEFEIVVTPADDDGGHAPADWAH